MDPGDCLQVLQGHAKVGLAWQFVVSWNKWQANFSACNIYFCFQAKSSTTQALNNANTKRNPVGFHGTTRPSRCRERVEQPLPLCSSSPADQLFGCCGHIIKH